MDLLWAIVIILVICWAIGLGFHIAGGLIHILLVVAVVILIFQLISGRRRL